MFKEAECKYNFVTFFLFASRFIICHSLPCFVLQEVNLYGLNGITQAPPSPLASNYAWPTRSPDGDSMAEEKGWGTDLPPTPAGPLFLSQGYRPLQIVVTCSFCSSDTRVVRACHWVLSPGCFPIPCWLPRWPLSLSIVPALCSLADISGMIPVSWQISLHLSFCI